MTDDPVLLEPLGNGIAGIGRADLDDMRVWKDIVVRLKAHTARIDDKLTGGRAHDPWDMSVPAGDELGVDLAEPFVDLGAGRGTDA